MEVPRPLVAMAKCTKTSTYSTRDVTRAVSLNKPNATLPLVPEHRQEFSNGLRPPRKNRKQVIFALSGIGAELESVGTLPKRWTTPAEGCGVEAQFTS